MTDRTEFELEVVQRLTRIETKMDIQNGIVKKNCEDIDILKDANLENITERKTIKKMLVAIGSAIGVISTVLGIIVICINIKVI